MREKISLRYPKKKTAKKILEDIPSITLKEKEKIGENAQILWRNKLIQGDNLPILKTLLSDPAIAGKVRLVYIDPPFSTGLRFNNKKNEHAYEDIIVGGDYLEYLRERLILLKELLSNDGTIYVHVDWKMGHYVKVIMDEIFGQKHFINDITRIKCNPKNFPRPAYGNMKDMILFYSKTDKYVWNESREKMTEKDLKRLFRKVDEHGRRYTTTPLHAIGETKNGDTGKPWKGLMPPKGKHWRLPPDVLTKMDEEGRIEWSKTGNPREKIYADNALKKGKKRQDIWEFKDPFYPCYPTEKNLDMLKVIIDASSNEGDLVLDCFSGSGTTLVGAELLNRRWIGIDNSELAIKTACDRLLQIFSTPFSIYHVA